MRKVIKKAGVFALTATLVLTGIALHWEWNIFLRMQRFWTLETICVA